MNLDTLKKSVLTGTDEAKSNFVSTLKARCVKPTDETVTVNGVEEKLFYNSENDTYFDRCMTIYRKCPCCGNIKPVSDFVTCPILRGQRYCHEGERVKRKEEFVCRDCVEEGNFVVPCKDDHADIYAPFADNGFYLYKNPDESVKPDYKTVEFEYRDEEGNIVHGFTYESSLILQRGRSVRFVKWNYETGTCEGTFRKQYYEGDNFDGIEVLVPGVEGSAYVTHEEVAAHPEVWKKCSHCGKWFHHSLIVESGMCKKCADEIRCAEICPYHSWTGKTVFMSSDSEIVDDHTLFFGLEIPVWHYASHVRENLFDPIADIFHLERVSDDKFCIVSQLMTMNYLKENIGRIKEVLDSLRDKGVSEGDRDFIINTPIAAYKDREALRRACGIVNRLAKITDTSSEFYYWSIPDRLLHIDSMPSTKQLDEIIDRVIANGGCGELGDEPIYFTNGNEATIPTVRHRMFWGTTDVFKIMAYVENINNIVKIANSNKSTVYLRDLFSGEYLPEFAKPMHFYKGHKPIMHFYEEIKPMLCFGTKDLIDKATKALETFACSGQPIEAADDAVNRLIDSLSALDKSESNE